jgi:Kdo2-lipid IVA lauroyltransferase/acyltransferase
MKKFSQALVYYSSLPFIYFFSYLPWPILFIFSDITFFLVYFIIRYRRKVVWLNLKNSFPEKPILEIKRIEFHFYRFFTDMIFEILKLITMSPEQKADRCRLTPEAVMLLKDLYNKGRSSVLVMGHYGNWEYCPCGLPLQTNIQSYVIYHPLTNPYFDKLFSKMRTKTSCKLYTMTGVLKGMITNRNEINITAFLGDQAPSTEGAYWMTFLNQDTRIFNGTEKIASKLKMAVVYGRMERIKRGKYIYHIHLICEDASQLQPHVVTEKHTRMLEEDIRNAPEYWLWTHRRWKYKRPEGITI